MKRSERKRAPDPVWLARLERDMPERLHGLELWVLTRLTAKALGGKAPALRGYNAEKRLEIYRAYTACILKNHAEEEWSGLRKELYRKAYTAGRLLARLPGIRGNEEKRRLIVLLYRNIGITLEGDLPGNFRVPYCCFSEIYTPQSCYVMSGMDAGLICGIFGGGSLTFQQRLTEGHAECRAVFTEKCRQGDNMEWGC